MSAYLAPEKLKQRTARAVDAAADAGRSLGLTVTEPVVLHDLFSVVVHLKPSDVVARVPVVLPPGRRNLDHMSARQQTELEVVSWLAGQGMPVVPPSPHVPASPVVTDEFSITMWQHVDVDPDAELDVVANSRRVPRLHQVLRDYPEDLPFLTQFSWTSDALAYLEENPGVATAADVQRAKREWEVLGPIVASPSGLTGFCGDVGTQPLHGDAPAANMLATKTGMLYADFEDPVYGPIETDLAFLGPQAVDAYNTAAEELGLRHANADVLRVIEAVAGVQVVACFAFVPDLPVLAEYLEYSLQQWRDSPFAGGVA